jgi:hypothetical protein
MDAADHDKLNAALRDRYKADLSSTPVSRARSPVKTPCKDPSIKSPQKGAGTNAGPVSKHVWLSRSGSILYPEYLISPIPGTMQVQKESTRPLSAMNERISVLLPPNQCNDKMESPEMNITSVQPDPADLAAAAAAGSFTNIRGKIERGIDEHVCVRVSRAHDRPFACIATPAAAAKKREEEQARAEMERRRKEEAAAVAAAKKRQEEQARAEMERRRKEEAAAAAAAAAAVAAKKREEEKARAEMERRKRAEAAAAAEAKKRGEEQARAEVEMRKRAAAEAKKRQEEQARAEMERRRKEAAEAAAAAAAVKKRQEEQASAEMERRRKEEAARAAEAAAKKRGEEQARAEMKRRKEATVEAEAVKEQAGMAEWAAGHEIRGPCTFCGKPVMQRDARYKGPAGYCHAQCFVSANSSLQGKAGDGANFMLPGVRSPSKAERERFAPPRPNAPAKALVGAFGNQAGLQQARTRPATSHRQPGPTQPQRHHVVQQGPGTARRGPVVMRPQTAPRMPGPAMPKGMGSVFRL